MPPRVALVVMPWVDNEILPLGVAALKAFLQAHGIAVDSHYLNLRMAARLGSLSTRLSRGQMWSEWLFGYSLFGPGGSGELAQGLAEARREPSFRKFLADAGLTPEQTRLLLEREVPAFLKECLEEVSWEDYDVIGFSSTFCSHAACLTLARALKERFPEKTIVFGGANVEGVMGDAVLKGCPWVDAIVDGEGEEAFLALLERLASGQALDGIPRVSFRRGAALVLRDRTKLPVIAMDRLPTPDHADYFTQLESAGLNLEPVVSFEASRGCWWGQKQHCTFCGLNGQVMAFRAKDASLVLRDIQELHRRHRAHTMEACDNILGLEHLKTLLPPLAAWRKAAGLDVEIFFEVKANLNDAQLRLLADAGVTSLQPGLESLSTPVLKLMRKGVRAIQNVQTLKLGAANGVKVGWNILWGFPGEEPAEYERMAESALALTHLMPPLSAGPLWIDRFSPHHTDWKGFGISKPRPQPFYRFLFPEGRFDLDEAAYFFDFAETPTPEHRLATERFAEAIAFWKQHWSNNFFACRRGEGFLDLYDSRPLRLGGGLQMRCEKVDGLAAVVLRRADSIAAFGELLAACREKDPDFGEAELKELLAPMLEKSWLYEEDGRYLFLAVPLNALQATQRAALEGMLLVEKRMKFLRASALSPA